MLRVQTVIISNKDTKKSALYQYLSWEIVDNSKQGHLVTKGLKKHQYGYRLPSIVCHPPEYENLTQDESR